MTNVQALFYVMHIMFLYLDIKEMKKFIKDFNCTTFTQFTVRTKINNERKRFDNTKASRLRDIGMSP